MVLPVVIRRRLVWTVLDCPKGRAADLAETSSGLEPMRTERFAS
ncbi:hypothetical protein [Hydrogenophaga sp.]|nr:hypothetical protein [Hydrogenophaga sp.]MDO9438847.1 hypothetical protein [Hydrogenophaga sp.]